MDIVTARGQLLLFYEIGFCSKLMDNFTLNLGMILSAQMFTYTISRFLSSWASDHYSPRLMFTAGMFLTGFVMLAFTGMSSSGA